MNDEFKLIAHKLTHEFPKGKTKSEFNGSDKVIEEIKERLSNLDAGKVVKYDHEMNLATQYMVDYKNDVSYLLSILEEAEKTLKLIANGNNEFPSWGDTVDILKDVRSIAGETLKSIQGDET